MKANGCGSMLPKVSRGCPVTTSRPTVDSRKPAAIMIIALWGDPPSPIRPKGDPPPRLVLFSDAVRSACGVATS